MGLQKLALLSRLVSSRLGQAGGLGLCLGFGTLAAATPGEHRPGEATFQQTPQQKSGLLPQAVFLNKTKNQQGRELYITVVNTRKQLFENKHNPITVVINGSAYKGKVFARTAMDSYHMWAGISPQGEGAIFVNFAGDAPYLAWQQCQSLQIVIDPEGKLHEEDFGPRRQSPTSYNLLLHDKDYSSDCRHNAKK